jgi:hemerythrin-like domain-containing protein
MAAKALVPIWHYKNIKMMNNSLEVLYDEHSLITEAIEVARTAKALIGKNDEEYRSVVTQLIRFFRVFADQYHHQKEEEILFPEMMQKNEMLTEGVIREMLHNHEHFRESIHEIEFAVKNNELTSAARLIDEYTEGLLDHIAVENDELFLVALGLFSDHELENIYFRFEDLDRNLGDMKKEDFYNLPGELGKHFSLLKGA